jgi:hypothetical protein
MALVRAPCVFSSGARPGGFSLSKVLIKALKVTGSGTMPCWDNASNKSSARFECAVSSQALSSVVYVAASGTTPCRCIASSKSNAKAGCLPFL